MGLSLDPRATALPQSVCRPERANTVRCARILEVGPRCLSRSVPPRRAYGLVIPHSVLRPRRPAQPQDSLQIGKTPVLSPRYVACPASIDDLEAMCGLHACDLGDSVLLRILRPRL